MKKTPTDLDRKLERLAGEIAAALMGLPPEELARRLAAASKVVEQAKKRKRKK